MIEYRKSGSRIHRAAENAIAGGFNGFEIHGANGYLVHQFIYKTSIKDESIREAATSWKSISIT